MMSSSRPLSILVGAALLALAIAPGRAAAQRWEPDATPEQRAAFEDAEAAREPACTTGLECLEREREQIDLGGPAAATLMGIPLAIGGGITAFYFGLAALLDGVCFGPSGSCERSDDGGLWAGIAIAGTVGMVTGVLSTVIGATSWARNDRARRRLTREIESLRVDVVPLVAPDADGDLALGLAVGARF